jgi:hypothetical protein
MLTNWILAPDRVVGNVEVFACAVPVARLRPLIVIHAPGEITGCIDAPLTTDVMTGRLSAEIVSFTETVWDDVGMLLKGLLVAAIATEPLYVPSPSEPGLTPIEIENGVVPVRTLAVNHGTFNETVAAKGLDVLLVTWTV